MSAAGSCWKSLVILWLVSVSASGQENWTAGMLDREKLDFGVIATGSEAVETLTLTNRLSSVLQITGVSTGCQCASASIAGARQLQPNQSTTIEVRINTLAYSRKRETTLTVAIGAPALATIQVPIEAYIRTDVVFDPGKLDFGTLEYGRGGERSVKVTYAGRSTWTIRGVKCPNSGVSCEVREVSRTDQPSNGINVEYALRFQMSAEAKPGRYQEYAILETDDAANPYIPLMIQGVVTPDFSISNPRIEVRALRPGQTAVVRVVVRGVRPFVISEVDCGSLAECFSARMGETEEKLQIVELQFTAPARPGRFSERMQLKVKGREESLDFSVSGMILE